MSKRNQALHRTAMAVLLTFCAMVGHAQNTTGAAYKAVIFDYFVLFDPNSIAAVVDQVVPGHGAEFTKTWRAKQFEYCFIRSITGSHADFDQVTRDALVYTAQASGLALTVPDQAKLLNAYRHLRLWPDAQQTLKGLHDAGIRVAVLTNFSPAMMQANAEQAGIAGLLDVMISTEEGGAFKPEAQSYALAKRSLKLENKQMLFVAFGGWDAFGAKRFGLPTYWVNRFKLPAEELGLSPDYTSPDLAGVLHLVTQDQP